MWVNTKDITNVRTGTMTATVAIVGGRDFNDYALLKTKLDEIRTVYPTITGVVSGGARGADRLGERYADEHLLGMRVLRPDWRRCGRGAATMRNTDIIDAAGIVVAFWDGKSRGTRDSIKKAQQQRKILFVYHYDGSIHEF